MAEPKFCVHNGVDFCCESASSNGARSLHIRRMSTHFIVLRAVLLELLGHSIGFLPRTSSQHKLEIVYLHDHTRSIVRLGVAFNKWNSNALRPEVIKILFHKNVSTDPHLALERRSMKSKCE